MTNEDRQILLDNSLIVREVVDCQMQTNRSMRDLFHALESHFPELRKEYEEVRKEIPFENASSSAIGKLSLRIDGIIERLKRQAGE